MKTTVANAVYQTSENMAMLKKSQLEKGFEEGAHALMYTVATLRLDWDVAFLSEHLIDQIATWLDKWRATHPLVDECPTSPLVVGPTSIC